MARGINENDVHQAADALVAGGERPTVERIRGYLGTGSPNTVTRWLETWWQGLGARLDAQRRHLAVPGAPAAVSGLAGEWWALALSHAQAVAEQALVADRSALQGQIEALRLDREAFATEAAALRDQAHTATHAQQLATAQTVELQRLARRLEEQLEEATQQREAAITKAADAEIARQGFEARIQALQDAAQAERESLGQHVRALEDRAYAEIDRARQETKDLQSQLTSTVRQAAALEKSLRNLIEQANLKAAEAIQEARTQRAKADTLEGQMGKFLDLPATLEAAIRKSRVRAGAKKSAAKQAARRS